MILLASFRASAQDVANKEALCDFVYSSDYAVDWS